MVGKAGGCRISPELAQTTGTVAAAEEVDGATTPSRGQRVLVNVQLHISRGVVRRCPSKPRFEIATPPLDGGRDPSPADR